jgi:hypothetical protein
MYSKYQQIDCFKYLILVEIDSSIPALKCELLPESTSEEILFISISPFSGLYKTVSYMGNTKKKNFFFFGMFFGNFKKLDILNKLNMHLIVIKEI